MLTASSEPCIGTDGQVASISRENHAFCAGRPDLLPDWSVKERLKAPARQNPVAQCHPIRQSCPQSAFSWGPSGKCRIRYHLLRFFPGLCAMLRSRRASSPSQLPGAGGHRCATASRVSRNASQSPQSPARSSNSSGVDANFPESSYRLIQHNGVHQHDRANGAGRRSANRRGDPNHHCQWHGIQAARSGWPHYGKVRRL